jgi:hypothetical protein
LDGPEGAVREGEGGRDRGRGVTRPDVRYQEEQAMFKGVSRRGWRRLLAAALGVGAAAGVAVAQPPAKGGTPVVHGTPSGVPGLYLVSGAPPAELPPSAPAAPLPPTVAPGVGVPTEPCAAAPCGPAACATECPAPAKETCRNSGCWGGPYGFRDCARKPAVLVPPLGFSSRMAFDTQRLNALAEYFVVYREDWLKDSAVLNESGERHLGGIARRMCMTTAPAKVEPSGNPELDARRLAALSDALIRAGVPQEEAGGRVVIGGTRAEGLRGNEIETVYYRSPFGPGAGTPAGPASSTAAPGSVGTADMVASVGPADSAAIVNTGARIGGRYGR